jgi:hypothetical protein
MGDPRASAKRSEHAAPGSFKERARAPEGRQTCALHFCRPFRPVFILFAFQGPRASRLPLATLFRASGARRSTTLCAPAALSGYLIPRLRRSGQNWLPSDRALARSQKCASAASTRCVDVPKDDGHRVGGDRVFRVCCIEENREGAVAETADAFVDHSLISLERFAGEATRIVFVNYL